MRMQVREFAALTGVSIRTLHYYDEIGLLKPALVDAQTGYRFYDASSLARMQDILFYRELDFPLRHICAILSDPAYDREAALLAQKQLLILKKQRIEKLIAAVDAAVKGGFIMDAFDNTAFEQYKAEAAEKWGGTPEYAAYVQKTAGNSAEQFGALGDGLMAIFAQFAQCMDEGHTPDSAEALALAAALQAYITDNFYPCSKEILSGLGQMYVADERFRSNIDRSAPGTAAFASEAIACYCSKV